MRVLNSIDEMLGNVAYAKGVGCEANVFAWVYPKPGRAGDPNAVKANCSGKFPVDGEKCVKNSENKFLFYLCPLYFNSNESTQLETQLHEASHHATAFTQDVCMEECYPGRNSSVIVQQPVRAFQAFTAGDFLWTSPPASYHFPQQFVRVGERAMAKILHKTLDSVTLEFFNDGPNCPSQFKAYGRRPCLDLAVIEPRKAIINADNLCYFVTDVVAGHVGQVSAQECTHGFCFGTKVLYSGEPGVDQDGAVIGINHSAVVKKSFSHWYKSSRPAGKPWGVVIYQNPDALADVAEVTTFGGLTADEAAAEAKTKAAKFRIGDKVYVSGQPATVRWDGRPANQYLQVEYPGLKRKTEFVLITSISLNEKVFIYVRFDGTRLPVKVLAEHLTAI